MADVYLRLTGASDGDDGPFWVGMTGDLTVLNEWVSRPPERFTSLRRLSDDGTVKGTDSLSEEINDPSLPKDRPDVLENIAELVGVGDPDETASLCDD